MKGIKFCLNASTVRPAPVLEQIEIAAASGYEAIELWIDDLDKHIQAGGNTGEVARALKSSGLELPTVVALHDWLGTTGAERAAALREVDRRLQLAAEIGAQHVIASPPVAPAAVDDAGPRYRALLGRGMESGVRPAMEFLGFSHSVHSVRQAWGIVDAAGSVEGSVVMDPFHILRGGGGADDVTIVPGDRVAIWHWNDLPAGVPFAEQSDGDRVMPGDGIAPLHEIAASIRRQAYSGYVSLELFSEEYWQRDLGEVAAEGLEKTRRYFAH